MDSLRDYQKEGISFLLEKRRAILADDTGLGKTRQALEAAIRDKSKTILIVVTKVGVGSWLYELKKWYGLTAQVAVGSDKQVTTALDEFADSKQTPRILITNYHNVYKVYFSVRVWDTLIADEAHIVRNPKATFYKHLSKVKADRIYLLTGTPVINHTTDLWVYLNLINKQKYPSYQRWCRSTFWINGPMATFPFGPPLDIEAFRKEIRSVMLQRLKKDHIAELPDKVRVKLPYTMNKLQTKLYESLVEDSIAELSSGNYVLTPYVVALITRLRQILISPALVGDKDQSGMLDVFEDAIKESYSIGRKAIVFTPFYQAFEHITKRLNNAGIKNVYQVSGKQTGIGIAQQIEAFNNDTNSSLLCTIRSGTSFTAISASDVYFLGFDWTPAMHQQAEDRAWRLGQQNVVRAIYLSGEKTIDDHVIDILDQKTTWSSVVKDTFGYQYTDEFVTKDEVINGVY